jgi:hypothetical protein
LLLLLLLMTAVDWRAAPKRVSGSCLSQVHELDARRSKTMQDHARSN